MGAEQLEMAQFAILLSFRLFGNTLVDELVVVVLVFLVPLVDPNEADRNTKTQCVLYRSGLVAGGVFEIFSMTYVV